MHAKRTKKSKKIKSKKRVKTKHAQPVEKVRFFIVGNY